MRFKVKQTVLLFAKSANLDGERLFWISQQGFWENIFSKNLGNFESPISCVILSLSDS